MASNLVALQIEILIIHKSNYSVMVDGDITLRKLQLLELKILLEFKRICEKHNIQYFLMGGTLLGAVRHQGFIPWDDDIDIGMIRSEYVKFLTICNDELSQEYFLQTFESDKTYPNSFAKLRLNGTEYPEPANEITSCHKGIFIDIFPFDHVPNNHLSRKVHRFKLMILSDMCWIKYGYRITSSTFKGKLFYHLSKLLSKLFSKTQVIKMREHLFQKYNKKQTKFYINGSLYCYPAEIFDQFSELEFEGIKFPVPAGYTKYLECAYGDYMRLPPEHERIRHTPYPPDFGKYVNIYSVDDVLKSITPLHRTGDTICKQ
ncbi:MAG TPA: LicD family protein [Fervidobacterium sp.]|nr:LicD family protein [Fervidobacterium sp.]